MDRQRLLRRPWALSLALPLVSNPGRALRRPAYANAVSESLL